MERKRTQRLLLEEKENGVEEFEVLGQVVQLEIKGVSFLANNIWSTEVYGIGTHVVKNNERLGPPAVIVADGVKNAMAHNGRQNLLNKESQQDSGYSGQDEVVDEEERLKLEFVSFAHPLATTENDNVVADNEDARLFEGGHGRDAGLKLELAGRISNDSLPGLAKDRP